MAGRHGLRRCCHPPPEAVFRDITRQEAAMSFDPRTVCIVDAHPHAAPHLGHALADSYAEGAREAGRGVERVTVAELDIPFLRDPADFATPPPPQFVAAQQQVARSGHLVVIYPLWLGTMPALMKAFFEQLVRAEFALAPGGTLGWPKKMLKGRSARVVVTMGMPAAAYRIFLGAHGVRGFESAVLGMAGFRPVRETLLGGAGDASDRKRAGWLAKMRDLGRRGA
jgi:putative NADPH-quinone reductase